MNSPLRSLCLIVTFAAGAAGCAGSSTSAGASAPPSSAASQRAARPAPLLVARTPSPDTSADLWATAENPLARYIVAIGNPTAHDDSVRPEHLEHARMHAAKTLLAMGQLQLAPAHYQRNELMAETTRRKLGGVVFECGVTSHDVDARGTHFAVNVTVVDLRNEDIVASLTGRATAPGPTSDEAEQLALEGALDGAMRGVPSLLASLDGTLSTAAQ